MKRVRHVLFWLAAGCAGILVAAVLSFTDFSPGPTYEGRSLRRWLTQYRENRNVNPRSFPGSPNSVWEPSADEPATWRRFHTDETEIQKQKAGQSAQVIRRAGTNCIPQLIKWISYEQSAWKQKLYNAASSFDDPDGDYSPFDTMPRDPGQVRAENAMVALQILGEGARAAVPELSRLAVMTNKEAAARAMACLPYMGTNAFWALIGIFTNEQFDTSHE